jgi:3-hydroxyacyl-CoA dehydrogenase
VPAGGGLAAIARKAAEAAAAAPGTDLLAFIREPFAAAAMAKVGTSAIESRALGYLQADDVIVPHKDELLYVAIAQARAMAGSGWRAPERRAFPVAGRDGPVGIEDYRLPVHGVPESAAFHTAYWRDLHFGAWLDRTL